MARVPEDPVDGGDGWDGGGVADAVGQQLLADLPGEHRGVLRLQPDNALHHARGRHLLTLEQRLILDVLSIIYIELHILHRNDVFGFLNCLDHIKNRIDSLVIRLSII